MGDITSAQEHCIELITTLGREWGLTDEQVAAYAEAIVVYLPEYSTDTQLQRFIGYYHLDHQEVGALRDPHHPAHQQAWKNWCGHTTRILRHAGLDWPLDGAIDFEDLTQMALAELNQAIENYRFNSRFSTWAYTVIVRTGQHAIRARRAAKRNGTSLQLDSPEAIAHPAHHADDPEAYAKVRELHALIDRILMQRGGPRWVEIFHLWAYKDQRVIDIGQRLGLSPARISVLLDQMRKLLRQNPALHDWRHNLEEHGSEQSWLLE